MSFIDSIVKNVLVKLAVCIPARDQMHTASAYCLWQLSAFLKSRGIESRLFVSPGTLIANQRHDLVLAAKDWGATHVMFIDSDIEFQAEDVVRLIEHGKKITAACYSKRVDPFINTAWYKIDNWDTWVRISDSDHGLITVDAVALGFCLIDISIFDKLSEPWFQLGYYNGQYTGEDIEFCRLALSADIPVHLDLDVSKRLKHLGTWGFTVTADD